MSRCRTRTPLRTRTIPSWRSPSPPWWSDLQATLLRSTSHVTVAKTDVVHETETQSFHVDAFRTFRIAVRMYGWLKCSAWTLDTASCLTTGRVLSQSLNLGTTYSTRWLCQRECERWSARWWSISSSSFRRARSSSTRETPSWRFARYIESPE